MRALGVLLLLCAVVFLPLFTAGPLTWDDDINIFGNPYFQAGLWLPFWQENYFGLYVPVTSWIWEIIYVLFKGSAWPYRVLNFALHCANVALLYLLLKSLAQRWRIKNETGMWIGLMIFALHPLQVHTVAWLSGGRDLLGALFSLLAVYVYFRFTDWRGSVGAVVLMAIAMLSKPSATAVPLALPLLAVFGAGERPQRSLFTALAGLTFAMLPVYMTVDAQSEYVAHVDWGQRILIMGDTFSFYLQKILLPFPLSANYGRTPESLALSWEPLVRTTTILILVAGLVMWIGRRDRRALLGLAWFALMLPTSGLFLFGFQRVSTVSDHYNYLPLAVVAAMVMWKWQFLSERLPLKPRAVQAVLAGLAVLLTGLSVARAQVWRNDETFFNDMAKYSPESYSTALGMSIIACERKRDFDAGVKWTEVALAARPNDVVALANQAYCQLNAKNYLRVVDLEFYLQRLDIDELQERQPTALSSLLASIGTALIETKEYYDGYQYLCDAYRIKPQDPQHRKNLDVAGAILAANGVDPVCEDPEMDPISDPLEDILIEDEEFLEDDGQGGPDDHE